VWFVGDGVQLSSTVMSRPTMSPRCECGCLLNQSSGHLVVVSSATDCPSERVWLIRVSDGMSVRLTVVRFSAQRGTVRVHDGNSSLSNLLLQMDAGSTAVLPQPFTSASSSLRVEYVSPTDEPVDVNGEFVALFRAVSKYMRPYATSWATAVVDCQLYC